MYAGRCTHPIPKHRPIKMHGVYLTTCFSCTVGLYIKIIYNIYIYIYICIYMDRNSVIYNYMDKNSVYIYYIFIHTL